jgi:hypothetical protein
VAISAATEPAVVRNSGGSGVDRGEGVPTEVEADGTWRYGLEEPPRAVGAGEGGEVVVVGLDLLEWRREEEREGFGLGLV